ncbi:uncharacterized protein F5147DRAFT_744606 [Suillus discolor]|uniref:Uncharacterized protein n=1 Tax=Suillus discolor TaxID=1912936 RepID=A0A9P7F9Z2_9AGAM|nr:uncharacterized protein F5147DRAFT_744606 [Suillus discolor]KAG2111909.1 hypothetical protein F5147DRAFT_744606 [Suillus discolor]
MLFKNYKDIHSLWEVALHRVTKFTKEVILVTYNGDSVSRDYEVHYRDLWDLAADMLRNPCLFPHFSFDAHHFSKFDGATFVHFVDKPFTAQDIWDIQSQLPPGAKPLAYILYADKTKLSSFGTAKGYLVYAHLVEDEKLYSGKPSWVNFKNTVWHQSFAWIISLLASKSQTGQWFECLVGIKHWFFLCILILSADFEEQGVFDYIFCSCVILWPCPVCLIPRDELWDASKTYRQRTSKESRALVNTAHAKETLEEREALLKEQSLHFIENVFWAVAFTCVFRALSHDRCHFNHGGLWSCHLWVKVQKYLGILGREAVSQVNKSYEKFPRWWNLKHPNKVFSVTFTDCSVHEDISKVMIIYAMHDVLTEHDSLLGYLLLRCVCLYLEMDIYAALEVHTSDTISEGQHTIQAFMALMGNFPKLYMSTHIFDDIEAKGTSCNYNTKPNEQMHSHLKDWYLNWTNFKNITEQILHIDHWLHVADDISRHISDFNEYSQLKLKDTGDNLQEDDDPEDTVTAIEDGPGIVSLDPSLHIKLGSKQAAQTFAFIESAHQADVGLTNFRIKLNDFLNTFLPACNILLPGGKRIHFKSDDLITECRFLQVNYESLVDWQQHTDYLRIILGHLIFLFECAVGNDLFSLALVHPFDLNLFRAEFFSVRSIICGALLVQDGNSLDYLIVDTTDMDMFLHVRAMHLQAGHPVRI